MGNAVVGCVDGVDVVGGTNSAGVDSYDFIDGAGSETLEMASIILALKMVILMGVLATAILTSVIGLLVLPVITALVDDILRYLVIQMMKT